MAAVEARCPVCSQRLVLDSAALRHYVRCPRCGAKHASTTIISVDIPIEAIRISDPEESRGVGPRLAATADIWSLGGRPLLAESAVAASASAPERPASTAAAVTTALAHASPTAAEEPPDVGSVDRFRIAGAQVGALGGRVLDLSLRLDRALDGRRAPALLAVSLFTSTASLWSIVRGSPAVAWVAIAAWGCLVGALLLARIDHLRDETGWRFGYIWSEMRDSFAGAIEAILRVAQLKGPSQHREVGRLLCVIGVFTNPLALVVDAWGDGTTTYGIVPWAFIVTGALIWWRSGGRFRLGLPTRRIREVRADGADAELQQLLAELESWRPRLQTRERDYQKRLLWRLKRSMADSFPDDERWLMDAAGTRIGRADILVGDRIIVEMKANPSSGEADRAIGQVIKYADYCLAEGVGPVVLVLCDTDDDKAQRIRVVLAESGKPLHVVQI